MSASPSSASPLSAPPTFEPRSIESLYATGHFLFQQERYSEAASVFRLMLFVAPTDERAWLALGECHQRVSQPVVALELYSAGSVVAAPAPRCALARARLLAEFGRTSESDAAYESAHDSAELCDDQELVGLIAREGRLQ
jgi:tetratricopeptide (TPR) repeat protein